MTTSQEQVVASAVRRLEQQFPLHARFAALEPATRRLYQAILRMIIQRSQPLERALFATEMAAEQLETALERLNRDDMIILDAEKRIVGAYPVTLEDTPHHLVVNGVAINAMCALDALTVGPMFGAEVEINSVCRMSGEPIHIRQHGRSILEARPASALVGIRWAAPTTCHAAHSMCTEMIFLKDQDRAREWQAGDAEYTSLFGLEETVAFGDAFFTPLLADS
ncbi:MAG: alkylmercury lyase family protein [Oscillochloridaceae bacterium]|nr:alkylmercury lyase family protein [Chloroflexaceae bacterium]MDW8389678.1 alkylmercury lyase family protein [Oscillochloridaceae bacterium]